MTRPLRIAFVLEATAGGTRKHLRELVRGLVATGFEVMAVVSKGRDVDFGDDIAWYGAMGCKVAVVPMVREIRPWEDMKALARIWVHMRHFKPDVIHTHAAKGGALGRLAALSWRRAAVVHTPHTLPCEWANGWRKHLYRAVDAMLGRMSDRLIALTNAQKNTMLAARLTAVHKSPTVIPNGVDTWAGLSRSEARRKLGAAEQDVVVAQTARLEPQKACNVFIEAAGTTRDERARFVVLGDGSLRKKLEETAAAGPAAGRITFMGYVQHAERYYSGIDVMVLTSLYEGLPYVVLEAMAAGLAVIAPDIPGMDEVVQDGRTGLLVPVGDAGKTAAAVARLVNDEALRHALGAAAREEVHERFPAAAFIKRHRALYEKLVENRQAAKRTAH